MIINKTLVNGTTLTLNQDEKFYDTLVSFKIIFPLKKFDNTVGNLLTHIFADRLEEYPTKKSFNAYLDYMYGAKVSSYTYGIGNKQVIDISVRCIQDKYAPTPLLKKQLELVKKIVLTPLINESTLNEAKMNMRQQWSHLKESPQHYSFLESLRIGTKDSSIAITTYGDLEDLDNIDLDTVLSFHDRVINEMTKKVYIAGDISKEEGIVLDFGSSRELDTAIELTQVKNEEVRIIHPGTSTNIIKLFETSITPLDCLYPAYSVFLALLGQLPNSLLFQNIREKESLCYSIYAAKDNFSGLFYINTSISKQNIDSVLKLIDKQFDIIQTEDIDIVTAKSYLTNQILGMDQRIQGLINHEFRNALVPENISPQDLASKIEAVTLEEVREVLFTISNKFTYIYEGENE